MASKSSFIILSLEIRALTPRNQNGLQTHSPFCQCKGHLKYKRDLLKNLNLFETDLLIILNTHSLTLIPSVKIHTLYTLLQIYQTCFFLSKM